MEAILTESKKSKAKARGEGLVPLPVDCLVIGRQLPVHLYTKKRRVVRPLFRKGMVFTAYAKKILEKKGITKVYIVSLDAGSLDEFRRER